MTESLGKVVLIFRDPRRGGNSVEELYKGLALELKDKIDIRTYIYNDQDSIIKNVKAIRRLNPRVIHVTSDMYFIIPFLGKAKKIITIHDIGRYKELRGWKRVVYLWLWLRIPVLFSDQVITISDYTTQDCINHIGFSIKKKVRRIYNPVPSIFKPTPSSTRIGKPKLLQVGTIHYKNLVRVIQALENVNAQLVIIGQLSSIQQSLLIRYNIDFINQTGLKYQQVMEQYVEANIVLFISTHEGFGMPIIEANAVGRPVICSSTSSLPEVAGDAALFVIDETSVPEIREKILQLISAPALQHQLVEKGFKNVERFKMSKIADEYLSVYRQYLPNAGD